LSHFVGAHHVEQCEVSYHQTGVAAAAAAIHCVHGGLRRCPDPVATLTVIRSLHTHTLLSQPWLFKVLPIRSVLHCQYA